MSERIRGNSDKKIKPVLNIEFLSHGTVEVDDVDASRKFYEEFLGLEVVRTSPISLMFRLGGTRSYAAVKRGGKKTKMGLLFHNGLDVASDEEVDKCHKLCVEQADKWGMTQVTKPIAQHGTYSFYFWDLDGNSWEILSNPKGGYGWLFERGDLDGSGHMAKNYDRPKA